MTDVYDETRFLFASRKQKKKTTHTNTNYKIQGNTNNRTYLAIVECHKKINTSYFYRKEFLIRKSNE